MTILRRALVVVVALALGGCVLVTGSPFGGLGRERALEEHVVEGEGSAKILVIDITGVIRDEPEQRTFGLTMEESTLARVEAELTKASRDRRVRAVVLRIDSPGGGVTASDEIYERITRWKRERQIPVVAALADTAASGGYYVACAADRIVAHPTTVTGSIGVVLIGLNVEGLMGKIGVRNQTFKSGEHKDILSPLRAPTPDERQNVQTILDNLHARFIAVVRTSRPTLDVARLPQLTDGRIFDASQALAAGLVDQIGSLHVALQTAKQLAGISEARVVRYRRDGEPSETVYARAAGGLQVNVMPVELGIFGKGPRFMYLWAPSLGE